MTDFYQSPADKLRFEILLKSLREGSLNLAIVGDDEVALANYARQIYDHLNESGEDYVEWWSSADSEKLVQRFNDILSELTVDEALDKSQKRSPKRYMIFPDTHAIQDFELQLLARLINGFPTSNINLVLVVNQQDPYEEKLAVFGKNLLQWILESESPSAVKAPKRSNKIETMDEKPKEAQDAIADFSATFAATLASGKFPGPGELKAGSAGIDDFSPGDKKEFDPLMDSPGQGRAQADEESQNKISFSGRVAAILIFAIVATVSALGLIYKDEVAQEAQALQDFVSGKKPATAKTSAGAKTPTPAPTTPATTTEPAVAGVTPGETAIPADGANAPNPGTANTSATASSMAPSTAPSSSASASPSPSPSPLSSAPQAPSSVVAPVQAQAPTSSPAPASKSATASPASTVPSAPPSAVGMSSSVKVPVKTNDSLIPNKEVVIAPKAAGAPLAAAPSAVPSPTSAANTSPIQSQTQTTPPTQGVTALNVQPQSAVSQPSATAGAPKPDAKVAARGEVKSDTKVDPKVDVKPEAKEAKPSARDIPKETVKEAPTREIRDPRETKAPLKAPAPKATVVAKSNEPLPKLDTKADKADKAEESKPKAAVVDSPAAFKPRPEDQRWVQGLPEEGWVMQHAALDSFEEARAFQQSSPFYRDAKVMYTKRRDAPPYYIVVTGPYSSRQDAESETRKHPIMAKSWVRSARSLKNQFEE